MSVRYATLKSLALKVPVVDLKLENSERKFNYNIAFYSTMPHTLRLFLHAVCLSIRADIGSYFVTHDPRDPSLN